jgi:hypothetical protein
MYIGADEGCHDVPDAIAPIDIVFLSLEPMRIPISLPFITNNGPRFISIFMPVSGPGICPIEFPAGLAVGIGIFICIGDGEGEAVGDA